MAAGQHTTHGGLAGWPPNPAQRVAAHPKRGQDRPGRVRGPFADRGQGSGAGQHGGDRDRQHGGQRMPSAAPLPGVGNVGEVLKKAAALVGGQRNRGVQPLRGGWGCAMIWAGTVVQWGHGVDTRMILESMPIPHSS